jgi:hypothetical protein
MESERREGKEERRMERGERGIFSIVFGKVH